MDDNRSLGQVLRDALPEIIRPEDYEKAAQAVALQVTNRVQERGLRIGKRYMKERAVIEAARAWARTAGNSTHGTRADLDLYEAVEALEAAEGEE